MFRTGRNASFTTNGERAVIKFTCKAGVLAAAAAFMGFDSTAARAEDLLYDWRAVNAASTPVGTFTPAPFITDSSFTGGVLNPTIASQLAATPAGKVAVKIQTPLSPANTTALFGNAGFKVNYAFLDFETPPSAGQSNVAQAQTYANTIHTASSQTFVGNFGLFPGTGDNSGPGNPATSNSAYLSGGAGGVNMANEDLYPGSPSYKNPGGVGGTSNAPNIRSTLFVLPINRASFVTANLPAGNKHVPYVNRFNNWGNNALDTDANPSNGYRFTNATGDQMLSRGDFSALVAHYRARGVNGVHLLDGGVEGYSQSQFETDASAGFKFAPFETIFNGGNAKLATLDTVVRVGGQLKTDEESGVVYSGVYSLTQASGAGKLAILVSNMGDNPADFSFQQKIGGKAFSGSVNVLAGQHKLLDFTGAGTQWTLLNPGGTPVFTDLSGRDGVGVPEPVALGGLALFGMAVMSRRRRTR